MPKNLTIIIVEKDRDRALQIVDGLKASGDHAITVLSEESGLARRIAALDPDVVLIDMASPSRDALEELALASGPMDRPVAMFVDHSDGALTKAAIEAGVSAYVVNGLQQERLTPMTVPFSDRTESTSSGCAAPPSPSAAAMGRGASRCAASTRPMAR